MLESGDVMGREDEAEKKVGDIIKGGPEEA